MNNETLAEAFDEFSRAAAKLAASLRAEVSRSVLAQTPTRLVSAPTPKRGKRRSSLVDEPAQTAAIDAVRKRKDGTTRRILVALAQLGRPLSIAQIGAYTGLAHRGGAFTKALAEHRAAGFVEGAGKAVRLTAAGREHLGEYAPLPTGTALFEFWCSKLGATAEAILRALRRLDGPATLDELGAETSLACRGGAFTKALAQLRKMELIEGGGKGMRLSPALRGALEPTVRVFDKESGCSVKVHARTGHAHG